MENKLTRWFIYEWGKPTRQKPHRVILRSSLPRIHNYHNKQLQVKESQYLIPTYSWTLTPIPNWTCSVVTISPFQCTAPSMWLTNSMRGSQYVAYSPTWEECWLQKFFNSSHDEDHKAPWLQYPTVYKHNSFLNRKMNLGMSLVYNMLVKYFCIELR